MTHRLIISDDTERGLVTAKKWFNTQRKGLGTEFIASVRETVRRIRKNPEHFAVGFRGIRQALVTRFSYVIYFREDADAVVVFAILHGHRDPAEWQQRN